MEVVDARIAQLAVLTQSVRKVLIAIKTVTSALNKIAPETDLNWQILKADAQMSRLHRNRNS